MSQSRVLRGATDNGLMFLCPGCNQPHMVKYGEGLGPRWQWNGDVDKPTFSPSILVEGARRLTDDEHSRLMRGESIEKVQMRCHSYVKDGRIAFLADCTHALAGQVVDLPEWDSTQ